MDPAPPPKQRRFVRDGRQCWFVDDRRQWYLVNIKRDYTRITITPATGLSEYYQAPWPFAAQELTFSAGHHLFRRLRPLTEVPPRTT